MSNSAPTIVVQSSRREMPDGASPSTLAAGGAGRPAEPSLRVEFDLLCQRLTVPAERRAALTDLLLRQRRVMGVAWFRLEGTVAEPLLLRLPGPAVDRMPVREWLSQVAQRLSSQGGLREEQSPEVRNLSALAATLPAVDGESVAVVLLVASPPNSRCTEEWLVLQQLLLAAEGAEWASRTRQAEARTQLAAALVDLTGRINAAPTFAAAGHELTRCLREHFAGSFVAVGLCPAGSPAPRLLAVSDGVDAEPHGQPVQRMEAALAEAALANRVLGFPVGTTADDATMLAHKRLAALMGAEMVVSGPLHDVQGRVVGAVCCAGSARSLAGGDLPRFLSAAAAPVGQALAAARRHEGGRLRRCGRRLVGTITRLRLLMGLLGVTAIAGVLAMPLPYRISAGCRLEPSARRMSPAPFDGLLQNTHVAPGDVVHAGQLLATMDGREVRWELAGVIADQERATKERDALLAAQEIAKSYLAELEGERLAARETLLRDRLERLEVRSPIDGVILSGSLDRRENVPVNVGQPLYEVAPLSELRGELEVPAVEISHVRAGMPVEIRMDGVGGETLQGAVERIRPSSEVRDGRNVFVAEITINNQSGRLRPGMEGTVRIIGDVHPLGWNLFHRAWEYLRDRVW